MRTEVRCRECGKIFAAEVVRDQFSGVCPRCLAGFALDEATQIDERPPLKPGATFRGMEVLEILGHGGMGVVYKARQVDLDRTVALKLISPKLAGDPEFARRFTREAKVLASLNHPNIVHIYEFGKDGDLYFLAMEFVDGVSLRGLLRERKLEAKEALAIVPQICEALEYAHAQGVVHRDIKPENILVDRAGKVKIADFGLAKAIDRESATRTNVVMGTPHYMAPEQYESTKSVDHRADIYSLGVVFYEMLTGEVPMGRFEPPSKRVQVDVRLDEVVLKALEREPERRYQRVGLVKSDVETIVTTPAKRLPLPRTRSGYLIATVFSAILVGSVLLTLRPPPRTLVSTAIVSAVIGLILTAFLRWHPDPCFWKGYKVPLVIVLASAVFSFAVFARTMIGSSETHTHDLNSTFQEEPSPTATRQETFALDLGGGVKMEFVRIKAGTFMMGGTDCAGDETPHSVTIGKDYWMQTTETTQAQWKAILGEDPSYFKGDDLPVETVSWKECQRFLAKLNDVLKSQLHEKKAALPTAAEWEYACRAGSTTRWCFGDDKASVGDYAWCSENSDGTHPVATKRPNAWGLFDMHGNVWERCQDGLPNDPSSEYPFERGGGFANPFDASASGCRRWDRSSNTNWAVGLRVVLR